jgi:hypothetical protein
LLCGGDVCVIRSVAQSKERIVAMHEGQFNEKARPKSRDRNSAMFVGQVVHLGCNPFLSFFS